MKYTIILVTALAATSNAVTLQVSAFGASNQVVFRDNTGASADGLVWGILVDKGDAGFSDLSLAGTSTPLTTGAFGGDILVLAANPTLTFAGAQGTASAMTFNVGENGVEGGETFALVWFDAGASVGDTLQDGALYGTAGTFTVPALAANGSTLSTETFSPIRGLDLGAPALSVGAIPEPSAILLGGLALLGGIVRRRR